VKRITIAAILAFSIHGFLLGLKFDGLRRISGERPKLTVMSIRIAPSRPGTPTPEPAPETPRTKPKKYPVAKKIKKKPKVFPESKPKKITKKVIQPVENDRSKTASEKTVDMPKPPDLSEQARKESVYKETDTGGETSSENQIIREARPLYRSNPAPKYPVVARIRGVQGEVVLEVLVGAAGDVLDLHVLSSSGYPILDRAAEASVKNWTFEPGMKGQENVDMWVRVPIRFELK
jgi:periplasmic protein TonB